MSAVQVQIDTSNSHVRLYATLARCGYLGAHTQAIRMLAQLRGHASRLTEIAVSEASEAVEEALATTDACGEGDQ